MNSSCIGGGEDIWKETGPVPVYLAGGHRGRHRHHPGRRSEDTHPFAKAGVMIRGSLDPGAPCAAQRIPRRQPLSSATMPAPGLGSLPRHPAVGRPGPPFPDVASLRTVRRGAPRSGAFADKQQLTRVPSQSSASPLRSTSFSTRQSPPHRYGRPIGRPSGQDSAMTSQQTRPIVV